MRRATRERTADAPATAATARRPRDVSSGMTTFRWIALAIGCVVSGLVAAGVRPVSAAIVYAVALAALLAASAVDAVEQRLPNTLTVGTGAFALVALSAVSMATGAGSPWRALAGGATFGAWILIGALAARDGYGLGDVKLAVTIGILLGWISWLALAIGVIVTQLSIVCLLLHARLRHQPRVALGPAFVAGVLAAILLV